LNNHKAALAQGANGRHAGLGVQPETVSASSPLLLCSTSNPQGKRFPAGILVSPAFLF